MKTSTQMNNTSEMKRFVSRHATTSSGAEGQLSTLRLLSLSKHNSQLSTHSYTGGGVQPNFSAVGRKQQFPQSNSANSAVGKKLSIVNLQLGEANCALSIVHCPLSIVNYPLSIVTALLILLCFLFAGSISAQDNYTVVVKCPTIPNQCGYMEQQVSMKRTMSISTKYSTRDISLWNSKWDASSSSTVNNISYVMGSSGYVVTSYSSWYNNSGNVGNSNASYKSALATVSTKLRAGFANFNIENLPTNMTVVSAAVSFPPTAKQMSFLSMSRTPTAQNSIEYTNLLSYQRITGATTYTDSKIAYYGFATSESSKTTHYLNYASCIGYTTSTSINSFSSNMATKYGITTPSYPTGSITITNSTYITQYHDFLASLYNISTNTSNSDAKYYVRYVYPWIGLDIENSRRTSTNFGLAFIGETYTSNLTMSAATNAMNLLITYAAPWSCVLAPSVSTSASSACVGDGIITLSAMQNEASVYVPIAGTKTWQWYSGTNGSNGSYTTIGGTFTATSMPSTTVQAPSNTGSVWYKYIQTIKFTSNATCTLVPNTSSKTFSVTCRPASVYISQCCTSLGSSPSFSATQVRDRSVNLQWSGMDHVDHYVIRYGVDGGVSFMEIIVDRNTTSKLIERLTNGRSYYFQIQAIGASGYCDTQLSTKTYLTPDCQ